MHERVLAKLALVSGQQIGRQIGSRGVQRHGTYRELAMQEKPCFVIMPMQCTDKPNKDAEVAMLGALRPPLDTIIAGDGGELYAVWASKAMVDKFREQIEGGSW